MSELHSVISSTMIEDVCARELLGRLHLDEFDCVCAHLASSRIEIVENDRGDTTAVRLTMVLNRASDAVDVEQAIQLTGLTARFAGTGKVVEALFALDAPPNVELKSLVL